MDGIYSMTFRGAFDWGIGMLVLRKEVVTGVDAAGVNYDGRYLDLGDKIKFEIVMKIPPGVTLVQGTPARPDTYETCFKATISKADMVNNQTIKLNLPQGPVNVIFSKLRELID